MPLSKYDPSLDYPGSWGDASEGWPSITFATEDEGTTAHHLAWKECKIPYGSYVLVDCELRLETEEYKQRVVAKLQEIQKP